MPVMGEFLGRLGVFCLYVLCPGTLKRYKFIVQGGTLGL